MEAEPNIILLGDFNEDPDDNNVLPLESAGLTNLMMAMIDKEDITRISTEELIIYMIKSLLVIAFDEKGFTSQIAALTFLIYQNTAKGKYKKYPFRFWAGNKLLGGYSDHLAVKVDFVIK